MSDAASNLWAVALYRKYRPATFAEVVGQEHVTDPLSTALDTGRISHAYLFSGPRGCGKTSSARILARSLNCVEGPTSTPCGVCSSCVALGPGGPGNLDVIELDAASHGGVDDTRELRDRAFYAPAESRYRVFIVDEAHMVTTAGFNALLKIVEEPPAHLIFVFATTEPDKVLPTIRSRTHHYPFRLLPPATMRGLLGKICDQEGVQVEEAVYPLVIRAGGGSPRDSLSVLDQLLAGAGPEGVTYPRAVSLLGVTDIALIDDAIEALATDDGAALFGVIDRVVESGHDPRRFATDLLERLRDLILMRAVPDAIERGLVAGPGDVLDRMRAQSDRIGSATLTRYAELLHEGLGEMRGATAPRLLLEVIAARMLLPSATDTEAAALQRLERIERRLAGGALPPAAAGQPTPGAEAPAATQPAQASAAAPSAAPSAGGSRRRGAEALAALRAEKTGGPTTPASTPPQSAASPGATPPQPTPADGGSDQSATAAQAAAVRHPELGPVTGGPVAAVPIAEAPEGALANPAGAQAETGIAGATESGSAPAKHPAGAVVGSSREEAAGFEKARETLLMLVGYASARAVSEPQWTEKLTTWAARLGALTPDNRDAIRAVLSEDVAALRELVASTPVAAQVAPIVDVPAARSDSPAGMSGSVEHGAAQQNSAKSDMTKGRAEEDAGTGFAFDPAANDANAVVAESDSLSNTAASTVGDAASARSRADDADVLSVDAATAMAAGAVPVDDRVEFDDAAADTATATGLPEMDSEPDIFAAADVEAVPPLSGAAAETSPATAAATAGQPVVTAAETSAAADQAAPESTPAGAGDVSGQTDVAGVEVVAAQADSAAVEEAFDQAADAEAAPASAGGGAVLHEVEAAWADIKAKLREFGPALPALLTAASVARVEGDTIVLAHQHAALAQRLSKPENVEAVRSTVRAVLGRDHDVRWEVGSAPQGGQAPKSGGATGGGSAAKKALPKFSRPSQAKGTVAEAPAAPDTAGWGTPAASGAEARGAETSGAAPAAPPDDDIPLPDGPDLPDDPGSSDYSSVGYDGVPPASTEEEEREMLAAAAQPVAPGDRRDPDEVALELLKAELGATPLGD